MNKEKKYNGFKRIMTLKGRNVSLKNEKSLKTEIQNTNNSSCKLFLILNKNGNFL